MTTPGRTSSRAEARRAARIAAAQALFQVEQRGARATDVVEEFRSFRLARDEGGDLPDLSASDVAWFADLVLGLELRSAEVDQVLAEALPRGWRMPRLDSVVRAVLRLGCFELLARGDVPARIVVDEYVSVARSFSDGPETGFVNGVLDALARRLRPAEFTTGDAAAEGR